MSEHPMSLLEYVNAPRHPSALDKSAVLLIDAQLEYVTGKLPLHGVDAAIAESAELLALARRRGTPVFHVVQHGRPGGALFDPDGPAVAIVPALFPIAGEEVIVKKLPSAFTGTDLHRLIQRAGCKELILAGFMTHNCVSSTARAALDLGYRVTVVAAATATRDIPSPLDGGALAAETVQRASLAALADRIAIVVPSAAAIAAAPAPVS